MALGKQIKKYRELAQLTLEQLSDISGVERGTIGALEVRDSKRTQFGPALARAFGLTLEAIADESATHEIHITRHDEVIAGIGNNEPRKEAIELSGNPDYPAIRRVSLKAQAGVTGYAVDYLDDDGPPIVFRKDWYATHNYQPEKMLALRVAGESMIPSLYAGDLIVINTQQTEPKDGIAFVVAYEGEIVVKRLLRDAGQWWLTSDNPDQRRHPRKQCDDGTQLIGEVVYRQTERI